MSNVLLTGGAGFIGSHTAKKLSQAGFTPVVLDNLSTGNRWAVKWGTLVEGDIQDYELVRETIRRHSITAVIHFAASAYVGESMNKPREYFQNNVVNSLELLRAMLDEGVNRIVFSSTCATYGNPLTELIAETHPQTPINPYGESKLFIEKAMRWMDAPYGLKSICLRYFNAAGSDPDGEIGEHHDPETHLIPLAILSALGKRSQLDIYGTDYATFDGSAIRDYIHVNDLAWAHVLGLQYLLDGGKSDFLNLGTGKGSSVKEVAAMVMKSKGGSFPISYLDRRPGDPASLVADASKAEQVLGWVPRLSDLQTIVETAWRWYTR